VRALAVAILVAAARAHADPLVLPRGELELRLSIEASLATRARARPLSYAPDAYYGVTDDVTVGVIHSSQSVDRIGTGTTFCVREQRFRCDRLYRGSGLDARWAWRPGVAWHARLLVRDVEPVKPAVTLGAALRWTHGRYAVTGDPYLQLGLANTDAGNRTVVVLPVYVSAALGAGRIALHPGIDGELATWRDGWHVPLAALAELAPARAISFGVEVGFPSLLGPQNTAKNGALIVFAAWHASSSQGP
jgi:hypothetical protein